MSERINISEVFGKNVFNESVMRERLPKSVFKKLKQTIENGAELDPSIADVVAHAMKDWAIERGATHYTHWFQPPSPPADCGPHLRPEAIPPGTARPPHSCGRTPSASPSASPRPSVPTREKPWIRRRHCSVPCRPSMIRLCGSCGCSETTPPPGWFPLWGRSRSISWWPGRNI